MRVTKEQEPVSPARLPLVLAALDHPQRLRVIAALSSGRKYVSALARELQISRPLLYLHLERLERAGLVNGSLELGGEGKAVKWYSLEPFDLHLTTATVVAAVAASAQQQEELEPTTDAVRSTDKEGTH